MNIIYCPSRSLRGFLGALVVLPTRELANQVYEVFAGLCPHVGLWVGLTAGRLPVPAEAAALREGCPNILVATPGRLMAHLRASDSPLCLTDLQFLVGLLKPFFMSPPPPPPWGALFPRTLLPTLQDRSRSYADPSVSQPSSFCFDDFLISPIQMSFFW